MTKKPPLLPSEVLRRTLRVARFDGGTVLVLSGLFALVSASDQDKSGTLIGVLVAGAGAIELHGSGLLHNGDLRGMKWLVVSQLCLLATILGYAEYKLEHIDLSFLREAWGYMGADQRQQELAMAGLSEDEFLKSVYKSVYEIVILLTIPFQGGMALYYLRRRRPVAAALAPESS